MTLTLTRSSAAVAVVAFALFLASEPAHTQAIGSSVQGGDLRTETIRSRPRPELDALGIRFGTFTLYSALEVDEKFDDNIYASSGTDPTNPKESDYITRIGPQFRLQSDWSRHNLSLFGGIDYHHYASQSDESYYDWRIGGEGRVDVRRDTHFGGGLEISQRHEPRASADDLRSKEPIRYILYSPRVDFQRRWNRGTVKLDGIVDYYDFFDGINTLGATVTNDGRDRVEYGVKTRLGYEFIDGYEVFVTGHYGVKDYILAQDPRFFVDRDSKNYGYSGGIRLDITGLLFGDFYGGQFFNEYQDSTFRDFAREHYGARLTWNISRLSTIVFGIEEVTNETTVDGAAASLDKNYWGSLDHELLRNLILGFSANFTKSQFLGESSGRVDEILQMGGNAKYMLNRILHISFEYNKTDRESTTASANYSENTYMIRFRLQK